MSVRNLLVGSSGLSEIPVDNFTHDHAFTYKNASFGYESFSGIAYAPQLGMTIAIGDYSRLMYTTDGVTWIASDALYNSLGGYASPDNLIWTGSSFIIRVGTKIYRSTNGFDWTLSTGTVNVSSSIDGNSSILLAFSNGNIQKSTDDGVTWFSVLSAGNYSTLAWVTTYSMNTQRIAYMPTLGRFCVVGHDLNTTDSYGNYALRAIYTSDGVTWSAGSLSSYGVAMYSRYSNPTTAKAMFGTGYGNGTNTVPRIIYTTNGTSFTAYNASNDFTNFDGYVTSIHFDGTNYVASDGAQWSYSSTGTSWTVGTTTPTLASLVYKAPAITAGNPAGNFSTSYGYITGTKGRIAYNSSGSTTFGLATTPNSGSWGSNSILDAAWAPNLNTIVTVGSNYTQISISTIDNGFNVSTNGGSTWSIVSVPVAGALWKTVVYANGIFVAGGSDGNIMTSPDGTTWTSRTQLRGTGWGTSGSVNSIAWNGSIFCAVGDGGRVATSSDGITWTYVGYITPTSTYYLNKVIWNGSVFCAIGDQGWIYTSPNGTTWTSRTSAAAFGTVSLQGVASNTVGRIVVAVNSNTAGFNVKYSDDNGATWTACTGSASIKNIFSVYWDGFKFIIGGSTTASNGVPQTQTSTSGASFTLNNSSFTVNTIYTAKGLDLQNSPVGNVKTLISTGTKLFMFTTNGMCSYSTAA